MAMRFIEGWDWLPSSGSITTLLAADGASIIGISGSSDPGTGTGRFGIGRCLTSGSYFNFNGTFYRRVLPDRIEGPFIVGNAIKTNGTRDPSTNFALYDSRTGQNLFSFKFDEEGYVRLYCGGANIGNSRPGTWFLDTWHYLEIKATPGPTGTAQVKWDGEIIIDVSGDYTPGTLPAGYDWGFDCYSYSKDNNTPGIGMAYDDMYICDQTGSFNNDYLGNLRVGCMLPDAPGDVTLMTAVGAASNWQAVTADRNFAASDPTYVTTDVVGNYDLYNLQTNVPAREVFGVSMKAFYRQTDAIQLFSQNVLKTDGTEYYGDLRGVAQTYVGRETVWEVNPFTGDPWTNLELADVQIGGKLGDSD